MRLCVSVHVRVRMSVYTLLVACSRSGLSRGRISDRARVCELFSGIAIRTCRRRSVMRFRAGNPRTLRYRACTRAQAGNANARTSRIPIYPHMIAKCASLREPGIARSDATCTQSQSHFSRQVSSACARYAMRTIALNCGGVSSTIPRPSASRRRLSEAIIPGARRVCSRAEITATRKQTNDGERHRIELIASRICREVSFSAWVLRAGEVSPL